MRIGLSLRKPKFEKIQSMLRDNLIITLVKCFIVIIIGFAGIGLWKWQYLPPQVPIFYSLPRSSEQLARSIFVFILPLFSMVFFSVNFFLASIFYEKEKLASLFLIISSTVTSFLLFITFLKIILLIT